MGSEAPEAFGWKSVMDDWYYRLYPDAVAVMEKVASECSAIFWPCFTDFLYPDDGDSVTNVTQ